MIVSLPDELSEACLSQVSHDSGIEGYTNFLRINEVWGLLSRSQTFPNWYTKLRLVLCEAEQW